MRVKSLLHFVALGLLALADPIFAQGPLATISSLPDCALGCLQTAVSNSPCSITDQTCICADTDLNEQVQKCVLLSCTAKEALTTKNATETLCHRPIRDESQHVYNVAAALGIVTGILVGGRLCFKYFFTQMDLGMDDWFCLLSTIVGVPCTAIACHGLAPNGLGRDIWTLPFDTITRFGLFFYVMEVFYFAMVTLLKTTFLFFYMRIFRTAGTRRVLWATQIINGLFGVAFVFAAAFQCSPVSYFWTKWDGEHEGKCININALAWANAIVSILLDIWMLAIPLSKLPKLQLHWKRKVGVALMFCVGAFITVVSIIRLQSLVTFANSHNQTWDQWSITNWSVIEMNVGIMCSCMPTMRLALTRVFTIFRETTVSRSENGAGYHASRRPTKTQARIVTSPSVVASRVRALDGRGESEERFDAQYRYLDETSLVPMKVTVIGSATKCTTDIYPLIRADGIHRETRRVKPCPAYHRGIPCDPIIYKHPLSKGSALHSASSSMTSIPALGRESTGKNQKRNVGPHVFDPTGPSGRPCSPIDATNDEASPHDTYEIYHQLSIESDSDSDAHGHGNLRSIDPSRLFEQDREGVFVFEEVSESDAVDSKTESILQPDGYESADSERSSSSSRLRTESVEKDDILGNFKHLQDDLSSTIEDDVEELLEFMRWQRELKRRNRIRRFSHLGMGTISERESSDNEDLSSSGTGAGNDLARRKKIRRIATRKKDSGHESLPGLKPATILDVGDERNEVQEELQSKVGPNISPAMSTSTTQSTVRQLSKPQQVRPLDVPVDDEGPLKTEKRHSDGLGDALTPQKLAFPSSMPRFVPKKESKFSTLAKNFGRLSREFEDLRIRDMEKRVENPVQSETQIGRINNLARAGRAVVDDDTEQSTPSELVPEATASSSAALPVNLEATSTGDIGVEGLLHVTNSDEDELESVVSAMPSLTTASTLSSTFAVPANLVESTPSWVLALLVKDETMRNLLASTSSKITPDKFQRNFLRLFRSMLSGIRADSEVADGDLRTGLCFLRHQSRSISSHICKEIFEIKDGEDWSALSRMRLDKSWQMKKYLAEYGQVGYPGDHAHLNEGELSSDSDLAGVDSVGIGTLTRQRLEVILLQSRSFLEFRERYRRFLFPDIPQDNAEKVNTEKDNTENRDAEESTNCPNDLSIKQQLESNLGVRHQIGMVYTSLAQLCHRITRPRVKQGYRRLEWTCDCKEELYADFLESDSGSLEQLRLLLDCKNVQPTSSVTSTPGGGTESIPSISQSLSRLPQQPGSTYQPNSGREVSNQQNGRLSNNHHNQRLRSETFDDIPQPSLSQKRFLELCVNTGEFQRHLGEINITDVETDSQLFDRVREKYLELRSFRAKYFLLKPVDVHFVQFSLEDRYRVGILDKPMAIPTEEEMWSEGYGYHPCPMKPPPIPAHIFLHYLSHEKGAHKRLVWGRRTPQKLHKSILETYRTDGLILGWGVHIIEGLDRFRALVATLAILFVSGVIGISWALARADVQGGVGIGAWLTSVQAVVLMMVLTKWNEL